MATRAGQGRAIRSDRPGMGPKGFTERFLNFSKQQKSIRQEINFSDRKFDVNSLPEDTKRVYERLAKDFGEEYALTVIFVIRTATNLHRAWHMTLLTSKILQQIKDKFKLRMTWELGVIKLKFRVEEGLHEIHRKVPYDYDSEFQDLYMKIAIALVEKRINIHQALIFQQETKRGEHTARSGLFLRDFPGRLVLYPLEAATCAVIFFSGDWYDAMVAAICGLVAGIVEMMLVAMGGDAKVLVDVMVGMTTGAIGGLFYRFGGQKTCLPAIFFGTLYWFFYGTAFVIGILEIVVGELETGVVRFMAVSVKTFVLTMGTAYGMRLTLDNSLGAWLDNEGNCGNIDLDDVWYRIPLYLLCSASALGQYRFPIVHYPRGLAIQLVGYEVQYQLFKVLEGLHPNDFLDTATANTGGAMAAVLAATIMSYIVDKLSKQYNDRLLQRKGVEESTRFGEFMYNLSAAYVKGSNYIGLGRKTDLNFLQMQPKLRAQVQELRDPTHNRSEIVLDPKEERILLEAVVSAENLNIWALLMPTVYQLVPGSIIARLWFNAIFPPPLIVEDATIEGTDLVYTTFKPDQIQESVFQNLMVIATSLALGLLLGLGLVQVLRVLWLQISCCDSRSEKTKSERLELHRKDDLMGVMNEAYDDDPDEDMDPVLERPKDTPVLEKPSTTFSNVVETIDAAPVDEGAAMHV